MHKYLRAVGFSKIRKKSELKKILNKVLKEPTTKEYVSLNDESIAVEYKKEFTDSLGIVVCGEYSDDVEFEFEYYYPYFTGGNISSNEEISFEERFDKSSYVGVCDDLKMGVTTIFHLQNRLEYIKRKNANELMESKTSVNLSALSVGGSIMLPLKKNPIQQKKNEKAEKNRSQLMEAARNGDELAIENLTLDDIDTYSALSRKIQSEDIFSLVDTYFMPYGIECDHYSVLGEIVEVDKRINYLTKEQIYIITIKCNDLVFDICINSEDLVGEPAPHRRFRGIIWMQGYVNFN